MTQVFCASASVAEAEVFLNHAQKELYATFSVIRGSNSQRVSSGSAEVDPLNAEVRFKLVCPGRELDHYLNKPNAVTNRLVASVPAPQHHCRTCERSARACSS